MTTASFPSCPDANGTIYTTVTNQGYQLYCDDSFAGSDLPNVHANSTVECIEACDAYLPQKGVIGGAMCVAVTFGSLYPDMHNCWLKYRVDTIESGVGYLAARRIQYPVSGDLVFSTFQTPTGSQSVVSATSLTLSALPTASITSFSTLRSSSTTTSSTNTLTPSTTISPSLDASLSPTAKIGIGAGLGIIAFLLLAILLLLLQQRRRTRKRNGEIAETNNGQGGMALHHGNRPACSCQHELDNGDVPELYSSTKGREESRVEDRGTDVEKSKDNGETHGKGSATLSSGKKV